MSVLTDRYELQELLGSGGMARVHAALDRRLGRRVAVKLVREDLLSDGRSRQRLLREARSAASFQHPNSVAVFDVGEHERQPFIVMELVEGESLADRLEREGRLSSAEAVRVGVGVLSALEAAHEQGLVHRDIKPANVLLPHRGGVKLADFGIAKAVAATAGGLTAVGDVMGTPRYLSPEQAAGQAAVAASDLYSLGVVLYECLAGEPPFTGESPVAVALAHQREDPPPLRRAAPDVPTELAHVVERALAKEPGERFADAAAMRRALEGDGDAAVATAVVADSSSPAATTVALPQDEPVSQPQGRAEAVSGYDTPAYDEDGEGITDEGLGRPHGRRGRFVMLALALGVLGALVALVLFGLDTTTDEPVEDVPADQPVDEPADDPVDEAPDEPVPEDAPGEPAPDAPAEPPLEEEPPAEPDEQPPDDDAQPDPLDGEDATDGD